MARGEQGHNPTNVTECLQLYPVLSSLLTQIFLNSKSLQVSIQVYFLK